MNRSHGLSSIGLALLALACAGGPPTTASGQETAGGFRFSEADGQLRLTEGERPVLVYNFGVQHKAGVPEDRARACYVHPIYGLDGEVLTDDFPEDHYHHRGLFWAWPHVQIGDQEYDLWALRGIRQQFERWIERTADRDQAVLAVENGWYVGERRHMRERIRFRIGPASETTRVIDIELQLTPEREPVTLWGAEGKSYGGFTLRYAPRQATTITTPEGRQPEDLNLTRLAWADLSARFADRPAPSGIAIFLKPDHPGFPPTWITRHYGVLGVGWPGIEPVRLEPGATTTCRYRVQIHRGSPDREELQRAYQAYAGGL